MDAPVDSRRRRTAAVRIQTAVRRLLARGPLIDLLNAVYEKAYDESSGHFFYFNRKTGESTCEEAAHCRSFCLSRSTFFLPRTEKALSGPATDARTSCHCIARGLRCLSQGSVQSSSGGRRTWSSRLGAERGSLRQRIRRRSGPTRRPAGAAPAAGQQLQQAMTALVRPRAGLATTGCRVRRRLVGALARRLKAAPSLRSAWASTWGRSSRNTGWSGSRRRWRRRGSRTLRLCWRRHRMILRPLDSAPVTGESWRGRWPRCGSECMRQGYPSRLMVV